MLFRSAPYTPPVDVAPADSIVDVVNTLPYASVYTDEYTLFPFLWRIEVEAPPDRAWELAVLLRKDANAGTPCEPFAAAGRC